MKSGSFGENMDRHHVSFYNFGEANEYTGGSGKNETKTRFGYMQPVVFPLTAALYGRTSRTYAGFNTNIPDQFRVDQSRRENSRFGGCLRGGTRCLSLVVTLRRCQ